MTQEEALIYLPIDEEDDLQDAYDEKLFELKQFFLSRFPMSKLIDARLTKFSKIEEAFVALGGIANDDGFSVQSDTPKFDSILAAHKWYNQKKNAIRLELSNASSFNKVEKVLEKYLEVTKHYAKSWLIPVEQEANSSLSISKEPDPMSIEEAFNELSDLELINSDYISTLPDENVLKSEAKRLSLWLKFEMNERSIR